MIERWDRTALRTDSREKAAWTRRWSIFYLICPMLGLGEKISLLHMMFMNGLWTAYIIDFRDRHRLVVRNLWNGIGLLHRIVVFSGLHITQAPLIFFFLPRNDRLGNLRHHSSVHSRIFEADASSVSWYKAVLVMSACRCVPMNCQVLSMR